MEKGGEISKNQQSAPPTIRYQRVLFKILVKDLDSAAMLLTAHSAKLGLTPSPTSTSGHVPAFIFDEQTRHPMKPTLFTTTPHFPKR